VGAGRGGERGFGPADRNKDIDIIFVHADSRIPGIVPVLEGKGYKKGQVELMGTTVTPPRCR